MTTYYVSSVDGVDTDNGTTWALAELTLSAGLGDATTALDVVLVDSAGTGEDSSVAINLNGPAALATGGVFVLSANRADDTYLAGAKVSIAAATNAAISFATSGDQAVIYRGLTFETKNTGNASGCDINIANSASSIDAALQFYDCGFTINATNTGSILTIGPAGGAGNASKYVIMSGCTWTLTNAACAPFCTFGEIVCEIVNLTVAFSGATKPTQLIGFSASTYTDLIIRDSDLSGFNTTNGFLFNVGSFSIGRVILRNCKLPTSPNAALKTGTFPGYSASLMLINCDSGDTLNVFEFYNKAGSLTETTSIYPSGNAQMGGTNVAWEVVTTSDCREATPFRLPLIQIWNDSTSSITVTVPFVHDSATALTDRDIWVEVSYTSSATTPTGSVASDRNASPFIGSTANQTTDVTRTWTGTGGFANENKQQLNVTFTPSEKCWLEITVCIAANAKTLYVSPTPVVT